MANREKICFISGFYFSLLLYSLKMFFFISKTVAFGFKTKGFVFETEDFGFGLSLLKNIFLSVGLLDFCNLIANNFV